MLEPRRKRSSGSQAAEEDLRPSRERARTPLPAANSRLTDAHAAGQFALRERRPAAALSKFLLSRGAWLVLLELTVIRICWTFNFDFSHYLLAGVIWMLGVCMMLYFALLKKSALPPNPFSIRLPITQVLLACA